MQREDIPRDRQAARGCRWYSAHRAGSAATLPAAVTLKLCSKVLQMFVLRLNVVPCHPTERDVFSMGGGCSPSHVGWRWVPFAELVGRAVSQGTSPSSSLSRRRRKSAETRVSNSSLLSSLFFSFFLFWGGGLTLLTTKRVVLQIHDALKKSNSPAIYGDGCVPWCCLQVLQTMLSPHLYGKGTSKRAAGLSAQSRTRFIAANYWTPWLKVHLLFDENLQKDRGKNYLRQVLARSTCRLSKKLYMSLAETRI